MALTKIGIDAVDGAIGTTQLENNAVTTAKIAAGAVGTTDIADSAVTSAKTGFSSETGAIIPPKGTTEQRPTAVAGQLRFNTTLNLMEYYDGSIWKGIDAPPVATGVSGYINENDTTNLIITGSNFSSGATVSFYNYSSGALIKNAPTVTRDSSTQLTVATGNNSVAMTSGVAVSIKITNSSGLTSTLENALTVEADPTWVTTSGSLSTIYDTIRSSYPSITLSATSATGTVTYAVQSGSLPTGLSLNTSTGAITGTAGAVGSDTTSSFTIRASNDAQGTSYTDRNFSITIKAPVTVSFTATGSSSWTVPTGVSSVSVLVVGGGGMGGGSGAGNSAGAGGGGGGVVVHSTFPVTPGGSVSYTVGAGSSTSISGYRGENGSNSVFGTMTANGGGGGGGMNSTTTAAGYPGGSGGGGGAVYGPNAGTPAYSSGGSSTQSPSGGGTGYGYAGGNGYNGSDTPGQRGGGGGGASQAGTPGPNGGPMTGGQGGNGYTWPLNSTTYAGGGGGGIWNTPGATTTGGTGGGGGGMSGAATPNPGTTNTGGGGGGGGANPAGANSGAVYGGNGGPGIIIVKY